MTQIPPCGFGSAHLHRVFEVFPQVSDGATCGGQARKARKGRGATARRVYISVQFRLMMDGVVPVPGRHFGTVPVGGRHLFRFLADTSGSAFGLVMRTDHINRGYTVKGILPQLALNSSTCGDSCFQGLKAGPVHAVFGVRILNLALDQSGLP